VAAGLRHAALLLNDPEPAATADRARQWIIEHGTASGPGGPSLAKFQGSPDVDGSALLVLGPYGQLGPEDPVATGTLARVEAQLVRDGGVHRYLDDAFYGGGLWVPLAGALALVRVRMGDPAGAGEALAWIERAAEGPENLPEQVPSHLRHPQELSRWEEVWGPSASPLLWSHAMYVLARRAMDAAGADAGDAGHTRSG
jgi:GH15 family glucan-1,4-alpha-glucosidase